MDRPATYDYWAERAHARRLAAAVGDDAAQLAAQMARLADPDAGSEPGDWYEFARTAIRLSGQAMTLRDTASNAGFALESWDRRHDAGVDAA